MLLRQQVIITLVRQFWIPTQSISHHIILACDVRDFRHLKLTKDSKPSLTDSSQIWLTEQISRCICGNHCTATRMHAHFECR